MASRFIRPLADNPNPNSLDDHHIIKSTWRYNYSIRIPRFIRWASATWLKKRYVIILSNKNSPNNTSPIHNSGSLACLASTSFNSTTPPTQQQQHPPRPSLLSPDRTPFNHEDCHYLHFSRRRRRCIFPCFYEGVCS